jgi:hypothetical protein
MARPERGNLLGRRRPSRARQPIDRGVDGVVSSRVGRPTDLARYAGASEATRAAALRAPRATIAANELAGLPGAQGVPDTSRPGPGTPDVPRAAKMASSSSPARSTHAHARAVRSGFRRSGARTGHASVAAFQHAASQARSVNRPLHDRVRPLPTGIARPERSRPTSTVVHEDGLFAVLVLEVAEVAVRRTGRFGMRTILLPPRAQHGRSRTRARRMGPPPDRGPVAACSPTPGAK